MTDHNQELVERLKLEVGELDHREPVPDDLQSEVRMLFNEALAGGPNMNGDAGPTLTPNHAYDCLLAVERIAAIAAAQSDGVWQPIETAPKDGTRILAIWLYDQTRPEAGSQTHAVLCWDGHCWEDNMYGDPIVALPTHWRPLPDPPALSAPEPVEEK